MIVVMAAGLAANLTFNPLKAVTTVTVQIVTLLVGDQEFDSPKTLAAFALGLLLVRHHPDPQRHRPAWWCANTGNSMNKSSDTSLRMASVRTRTIDIVNRSLARRYKAERRFRLFGISAIVLSLIFLSFLFVSIIGKGYPAFQNTYIKLDVSFDPDVLRQDALSPPITPALVKAITSQHVSRCFRTPRQTESLSPGQFGCRFPAPRDGPQ